MLLGLLAAMLPHVNDPPVFHGRQRQLDIPAPRVAAEVVIDGKLDEPVWQRAALLTGFSRYSPTDGVSADDSTEVLVWYSPTAIHFGIRAFAVAGTVNATLADRDKIYSDDYIGIFLGTFNDRRQATVFAVNPLGAQGDGTLVERGASGGGFGGLQNGRESTDLSPDFVFQSKGRITDYGYEIEVRIPFKSLRYQSAPTQTWAINVMRKVQSRGYEYSWAPAQRAAASYVGQFGTLSGLTQLDAGMVLEANPVLSSHSNGAVKSTSDYGYTSHTDVGANFRWGITNNWTLNGTINPDFAEVESDAGQAIVDPRVALRFPEKRPFFLEGSDQFTIPNQLVYTRRIANPDGALKLTGKNAGTSIALLSALDGKDVSANHESHPLYNILRVQRDVGSASRAGFLYTDRREDGISNQVAAADFRLVLHKIYSGLFQAGTSVTRRDGSPTLNGQVWLADLRRSGRTFGARYLLNVLEDDFRTQVGFISRPAVAHATLDHSYTVYGKEGSTIQSASTDVVLDGTWQYQKFVHSDDMIEKKLHWNNNVSLRGGWQAGASILWEKFGYDKVFYSDLVIQQTKNGIIDTVPFTGVGRIPNRDYLVQVTTPNFKRFSSNIFYLWGKDENFYEWASADIGWFTWAVNWRPTDQLRITGNHSWQYYHRPGDGSLVGQTRIPRLKIEYQVNRSIFVRAVGEYYSDYADDLRDDSRTNFPLYRKVGAGLERARGFSTADRRPTTINEFRPQLLFSYLPSPGTVLYAGYGGTLTEPDAFGFDSGKLSRKNDSFFVKLSYLLRN